MISKKTNNLYKRSYRPYYDKRQKLWKEDFTDQASEEGNLEYVASEYARTGLIFPYNTTNTKDKDYHAHMHTFEGVLSDLLEDPRGFTIEGFEEYYSKQEQEMLAAVQKKLLEEPTFKK